MAGIDRALANAQGLQNRLLQKFGELKRPVISKSKSAQEVEEEERGLKSMQEKLSTLENKLRVFRDLDTGKADERANVMTSLDGARRELLAAAREFEAYSFGSKDVIRSIMEFCQLKQAQADAATRSFKHTFKSGAPSSRRDVQPQQHADQNQQPSAKSHSAGSSGSGFGVGTDQSTSSVTVAPTPSHLSSSASKRFPLPTEKEQAQPPQPQPQPQQASLGSRLPRFPADAGNNTANDNGNNSNNNGSRSSNSSGSSGISVAATAAAFSGPSGTVAPGLQRPNPGSLNIRVPSSGLSRTRTSNSTSATSSAANSVNNNSISNNAHSAAAANNIRASNNSSSSGEPASATPPDVAAAATALAEGAANSARGSTSSSSLSRASSLPKAPGGFPRPTIAAQPVDPSPASQQAAPAAGAAAAAAAVAPQPFLPSTPPAVAIAGGQSPHASSPSPRVDGPPLSDHSPQVTQDSSMCNMESMCGAGTYPGAGGQSTTPTNPSAAAVGEPSARLKALAQLHGQDTASSIPAPPPAVPQCPRMLDAYMGAASSSSPNQQQQQQQQQDLLQDQRESELTLGHVFAKPSAVAATGSLRPSHQLLRVHTPATTDATSSSSSSGTRSATPPAAFSLSLPATRAAAAAAHTTTPGMTPNENTKPPTAPHAGAPAHKAGSATAAVAQKLAPASAHPEPPQEEEVEGSSSTSPGPHRTTTDHPRTAHSGAVDARVLSPALSSTYSPSDSPPNKQQGGGSRAGSEGAREGRGGAAMQEADQEPVVVADSPKLFPNDDGKSLERRKRAEATAAAVFAAKRSTDSVGAAAPTTPAAQPPGSSHVAKLQQRFLQTPQQQRQQQREQTAPTPCTDSVLGMLRNSGQHKQQGHGKQGREDSDAGVIRDESVGVEGARREREAEVASEGGGEAGWEVEAQRTTARAPTPARAQQLDRFSSAAAVNMHPAHTMHLQTPSSHMTMTAADRQLAPSQQGQAAGGAAMPADSHPAPPAQYLGPLQRDGRPTAVAAAAEEAVPDEQQQYRTAAAAAGAANPGWSGGVGGRAVGASVPPPSVLAAGPQLVAAGLVSVPPTFARERPAMRACEAWEMEGKASRPAMRTCETWEMEGEDNEVVQEQQALLQRQALEALLLHQHAQYGSGDDLDAATFSRRHTAPDPALMEHLQQQLRACAPRGVPALGRGPSCYVGGGGRKKKRGVWGGVLRVLGITTTVASVVVATGAAVFAAAALNTGLDELDLMHPEASTPSKNGSRGPFRSKVQRAKCPQGSSMRHPDALAAGRG